MKPEVKPVITFCPGSRGEWRQWLQTNHDIEQNIWLIFSKKGSGVSGPSYSEAVEEALCFGWIDSKKVAIDERQYMQFFSRRKATSVWSRVNKAYVSKLGKAGLMTAAGLAAIKVAKQNGSWKAIDDVEKLSIPPDLSKELQNYSEAEAHFAGLSRTAKRAILQWLILAKRPETRQRRIHEIALLAAQRLIPPQFRAAKTAAPKV